MRRIAVMQPYFFPYAGYYRLLALADCFVVYDCVQFNRRGRVHRGEVPAPSGGREWLTLPLKKKPRETTIHDLEFHENARELLDKRLSRYEWLKNNAGPLAQKVIHHLHAPLTGVLDFLEQGLRLVVDELDFYPEIIRSSELNIPHNLHGQSRIIAIVKALGGQEYINSPGGRQLYDAGNFNREGVRLRFLSPYQGENSFMLPALMSKPPLSIREDILKTCLLDAD